jgi:valyl-tRNA synthetase
MEFGWYLELTNGYLEEYKDLYTFPDPDELEIRQNKMRDVHDVAWRVLETVLRQMSPIIPHVAEELWQYVPDKYSFRDGNVEELYPDLRSDTRSITVAPYPNRLDYRYMLNRNLERDIQEIDELCDFIETRKSLIEEEEGETSPKFEMTFLTENAEKAEFLEKCEVWIKSRVGHEDMVVEIGQSPALIEEELSGNSSEDTFDKTIKFKDFHVSLRVIEYDDVDEVLLQQQISKINHQLAHIKYKLLGIEEERADLGFVTDESLAKKDRYLQQVKMLLQRKINFKKQFEK